MFNSSTVAGNIQLLLLPHKIVKAKVHMPFTSQGFFKMNERMNNKMLFFFYV